MRQALAGAILSGAPGAAGAAETCGCDVTDLIGFDHADTACIRRNLEETFRLTIGPGIVRVAMHSDHFAAAETTRRVTDTRAISVTAAGRARPSNGVIVFPRDPQARIDRNGRFNAVIGAAGTFISNNRKLRCQ